MSYQPELRRWRSNLLKQVFSPLKIRYSAEMTQTGITPPGWESPVASLPDAWLPKPKTDFDQWILKLRRTLPDGKRKSLTVPFYQHCTRKEPSLFDMMLCIVQEAAPALDAPSFADWAVDHGGNPDSIHLRNLYRRCRRLGLRTNAFFAFRPDQTSRLSHMLYEMEMASCHDEADVESFLFQGDWHDLFV